MMVFWAAADEQHNRQEVTAPENNGTDNMVTMGIERLQRLVQQPPSEYASTDRNEESAMALTDSNSSAETRYRTRGRKKDRKGRQQRHLSRTPSTSPSLSPQRYRSRYRQRRISSRKPTNGISNRPVAHIATNMEAMA